MVLAGCAGSAGVREAQESDAGTVTERAQARWDALKARNFDAAYELVSPASRQVLTKEAFRRKSGLVMWDAATIKGVSCQTEDVCTVEVEGQYVYRARNGATMRNYSTLKENWSRISGRWWYIPPDLF